MYVCYTYTLTAVTLLSELWPPSPDSPEDAGRVFSASCPFTIDEFLVGRNTRLLPAFESVQPMPGAVKLVQHLAKHGVPICVRPRAKRV